MTETEHVQQHERRAPTAGRVGWRWAGIGFFTAVGLVAVAAWLGSGAVDGRVSGTVALLAGVGLAIRAYRRSLAALVAYLAGIVAAYVTAFALIAWWVSTWHFTF